MKWPISCCALGLMLGLSPLSLYASSLEFLIGPPSLGQGGSNPLSIPPANPVDWQVVWVNAEQRELVFSLVPGIFYGQRWYLDSFYAALDAGLLVTTNGLGLGVAHALGYQSGKFWKKVRYQAEYRQVAGVAKNGLQFPYAIRMGLSYEF